MIDYQSRKPIYEQIIERYQTLILTSAIEPDSKLPSVRSLAVELSINPNTIQKAFTVLEQKGYIYSVKGCGNFVLGNSELKKHKHEEYYKSLQELVEWGKCLDITKDIFLKRAEEYFMEGRLNDRN